MRVPEPFSENRAQLVGLTPPYPPAFEVEATAEASGGLQLDFAALFRRYVLLAVLLVFLGTLGGILSVAMTAPRYKARALLEVQPLAGGILKVQGIPDFGSDQIDMATEAQILQSNTFLRQVVERLQLENLSPVRDQSDIFARLRKALRINQSDQIPVAISVEGLQTGKMPGALAMALMSLKASPIIATHLIEITCESTNPKFAADFLNELIDEFTLHHYQARMEAVRSMTQWISGQLEEAKNRMTESQARLDDFARSSSNTFVNEDNTLAESKLRDIQARLAAASADLVSKETQYETVHKATPEALPNVLEDPTIRQYQARIADLRREEANLLTTLTPQHPRVKSIEAQIVNLQAGEQKELSAAVKRIDNQYEAAKRSEELLKSNYAAAARQVASQTGKEAQYNTLRKESDSAREAYQALLLQANQASIAGSLPVNNVQAIDRALPAERPYKPKPLINIGGGAAAGLALCCGIIFLREKMDKRVSSPIQARQLFNLPQLGVIPSVSEETAGWSLLPRLARDRGAQHELITGAQVPGSDAGAATLSASSGNPLIAESFRVTLASLMRETLGQHRPQVILVTSPGPEEGKTTIASNLAIALAETGRSVLIVDGDFRRPRAHKLFGIANARGLVDLLNEELPVGSYPREALGVKTSVPHLMILPNGSLSENVSKILYSTRFRELIQRLRREFDTVLIDAPPMLHIADARVMSELVDGAVLVIRVGVTEKNSATEALAQMRSDRTVVLGTVLNDWKPSKAEARKRYYYNALDSSQA